MLCLLTYRNSDFADQPEKMTTMALSNNLNELDILLQVRRMKEKHAVTCRGLDNIDRNASDNEFEMCLKISFPGNCRWVSNNQPLLFAFVCSADFRSNND